MNKEFIPYEQALELKELGFNEPCLTWFFVDKSNNIELVRPYWDREFGYTYESGISIDCVLAPLYQQAFRWFRDTHKMHSCIDITIQDEWYFSIYNLNAKRNFEVVFDKLYYPKYEEAELECLKKLIQIIKNK